MSEGVVSKKKMKSLVLTLVSLLALYSVNCDVYFEEKFPDGKFIRSLQISPSRQVWYRFFDAARAGPFGLNSVFHFQIHGNPTGSIVSIPEKNSASSNWALVNSTMTQRKIKVSDSASLICKLSAIFSLNYLLKNCTMYRHSIIIFWPYYIHK